jgi:ParB family transcriptional regulator, chromosome partitioning protein
LARPDFREAAARRLAEERELSPAIISLISNDAKERPAGVRNVPLDHIEPNPEQPRMTFDEEALNELAASIREHGVLQPVLVRPSSQPQRFQLIAGERRWRAAQKAELRDIPALIEEIDDDTALEIAIIENLQREDISPLDEAALYDRMVSEHGYSIRKLADKLGKDKGYVENRLRLADAPDEIRELVSLRKDTLSHAYELLKVQDPKRRRRLADQVARGELTLIKLRDRIEGRRGRIRPIDAVDETNGTNGRPPTEMTPDVIDDENPAPEPEAPRGRRRELSDDSLVNAKAYLADALDELVSVLRTPAAIEQIPDVDRTNLAKYLTIAKLKLENAITMVRVGEIGD